jgi:hypothetical protein
MKLRMRDEIDESEAGFYGEAPDAGPSPVELNVAASIWSPKNTHQERKPPSTPLLTMLTAS